MEKTIYADPAVVRDYVVALLGCYNVSAGDAGLVADNLIDAEIRGISSDFRVLPANLVTRHLIKGSISWRMVSPSSTKAISRSSW